MVFVFPLFFFIFFSVETPLRDCPGLSQKSCALRGWAGTANPAALSCAGADTRAEQSQGARLSTRPDNPDLSVHSLFFECWSRVLG